MRRILIIFLISLLSMSTALAETHTATWWFYKGSGARNWPAKMSVAENSSPGRWQFSIPEELDSKRPSLENGYFGNDTDEDIEDLHCTIISCDKYQTLFNLRMTLIEGDIPADAVIQSISLKGCIMNNETLWTRTINQAWNLIDDDWTSTDALVFNNQDIVNSPDNNPWKDKTIVIGRPLSEISLECTSVAPTYGQTSSETRRDYNTNFCLRAISITYTTGQEEEPNPITVAELINNFDQYNGQDIWISGHIIGSVTSADDRSQIAYGAEHTQASDNIVLADLIDGSLAGIGYPQQLLVVIPSNTELDLAQHPELLGHKILIHGNVGLVRGGPGLNTVTDYRLIDGVVTALEDFKSFTSPADCFQFFDLTGRPSTAHARGLLIQRFPDGHSHTIYRP